MKRQRIGSAAGILMCLASCCLPHNSYAQAYNGLAQASKWRASGPVTAVAFSPDDNFLAGATRGLVVLWNSEGQQVKEFPFQENIAGAAGGAARSVAVRQIAFAPNGQVLAAVGASSSVRVWDVASGKALFDLQGHARSGARSIAFSANSALLATGGHDKLINLWDVRSGQLVKTLEGHGGAVAALAFDRDGVLTSISAEKTGAANCEVKRWNIATGNLLGGVTLDYVDPYTAVLSPGGRIVCSQVFDPLRPYANQERLTDGIRMWDGRTGAVIRSTGGTAGYKGAASLVFAADGAIVASVIASEYGGPTGPGFSLWDVRSGRSLAYDGNIPRRFRLQTQPLALAFSHNAKAIAIGCGNSTVEVWVLAK